MTTKLFRLRSLRRIGMILIGATILVAASIAGTAPARAASIWASGDPILINVQTGGKNYSNDTQWVSSINIYAPTSKNYDYGCGTFEAWTQNYYVSTQACGSASYNIGRWVGTGNYVCGAFTPFDTAWPRAIACIGISV